MHERDDRRVFLDEFPGLNEPFGDGAGHGGPDDGVAHFLLGQLVRGAAVLEARLEAADRLDRSFVLRLRDLQLRARGFHFRACQQAPQRKLFGPLILRSRIIAVRCGGPQHRDLIVGQGLAVLACHAQLRFGLLERALRALQCELELPGGEANELLPPLDFIAKLHGHGLHDACGFGADFGLIRRNQRSGEIDGPLN